MLRSLLLTLLYFSAIFTVFAYIGPVLIALNPVDSGTLSLTLMVFGLAGVAGTLSGGWATDRFGQIHILRAQLALLLDTMLLVPLTRGHYATMITAIGAAAGGAAGVVFGFDKLAWVGAVFAMLGTTSFVGEKTVPKS